MGNFFLVWLGLLWLFFKFPGVITGAMLASPLVAGPLCLA
jgi:hypothetical protein